MLDGFEQRMDALKVWSFHVYASLIDFDTRFNRLDWGLSALR
jgi:hypothetical protein